MLICFSHYQNYLMIKIFATLCFISAMLLTLQSHSTSANPVSESSSLKSASNSAQRETRPSNRRLGIRKRAFKASRVSRSALHEAAGLQLEKSDLVHWDAKKFALYLRNLNEEDAHQLVRDIYASSSKGAQLDVAAHPLLESSPWGVRSIVSSYAYNTKSAVLGGVLAELASRDFAGTLRLMSSLSSSPISRFTDRYLYESILQAGFTQAPKMAWDTYVAKCSTSFG